jgi:hypothetical protein
VIQQTGISANVYTNSSDKWISGYANKINREFTILSFTTPQHVLRLEILT